MYGERETRAFAELPPFTAAHAAHLSHLTLMRLMPGLIEADLAAVGAAITEIQEILGQHFAVAQGGSPWTSPAVGSARRPPRRGRRRGHRPEFVGADGVRLRRFGGCGWRLSIVRTRR